MYRKVMVPLDGSKLAECSLEHVERLADKALTEEIVFVRVIDSVDLGISSYEGGSQETIERLVREAEENVKRDRAAATQYLDQVTSRFKTKNVRLHSDVLQGRAADLLAEYAEKNGIDLIVIATHGRSGVSRWIRGSTADRILTSAGVPVMMIPAPGCGPNASTG